MWGWTQRESLSGVHDRSWQPRAQLRCFQCTHKKCKVWIYQKISLPALMSDKETGPAIPPPPLTWGVCCLMCFFLLIHLPNLLTAGGHIILRSSSCCRLTAPNVKRSVWACCVSKRGDRKNRPVPFSRVWRMWSIHLNSEHYSQMQLERLAGVSYRAWQIYIPPQSLWPRLSQNPPLIKVQSSVLFFKYLWCLRFRERSGSAQNCEQDTLLCQNKPSGLTTVSNYFPA